jgi:hypothetical protein
MAGIPVVECSLATEGHTMKALERDAVLSVAFHILIKRQQTVEVAENLLDTHGIVGLSLAQNFQHA